MGDGLWTSSAGYTVNNPAAWGPPVPPPPPAVVVPPRYELQRGVKRQLSESDDCDDVFSEESSKDRCSSPSDDCQMGFSRKKRRGIIEKRRRDRINSSLLELRRLVPSAFEKQGSAKLEKAEILQMTVDHLKALHAKGLDALSYDPHKYAMDYHNIGFRECAAEVARYLVTVEGMDIQDPLRLRLMSHLQCFAAQRELAAKPAGTPWNYNSYSTIHEPYPPTTNYEMPPTAVSQQQSHLIPTSTIPTQTSTSTRNTALQTSDGRLHTPTSEHHLSPNRHLESPRGNSTQVTYPGHNVYQPGFSQQGYNTSGQVKPYRPWGAEVAY